MSDVQYSPFGPITAWSWGNGTQSSRSFDIDGHLTQIQSAGTSTYTFLDDGTIGSRSDDAEHDYSVLPGITNFAVNTASNQLTGATGVQPVTYSYDLAGNTLGNGTLTFGYNGAGRMVAAQQGTSTTSFTLNGLGQRVSKSSSAGTTFFAYDEQGHLIGECTGTGTLIEETVWMGDIPVATLRPNASGTIDIYYVHTDHLNAPRRVTRSTDNMIVWLWNSDPYGLGFMDNDPDGDGQGFVYNLRFPGQYYDVETGLNYNMERDYDPATGRYIESDPLGLKAGIDTYAYVDDNPVSYVDPTGLASSTIQCDGKGHCEVVNNNRKSCDAACTRKHEQSHIADWKRRYGADSCQNKKKGYLPLGGPEYAQFLKRSECKAYKVGKACRESLLKGCSCKADAQSGIDRDNAQIAVYCTGGQ